MFCFFHNIRIGSGAYSASYPVGIEVLSVGVKQLGFETDPSLPSSVGFK
jgi:hypothetical protein